MLLLHLVIFKEIKLDYFFDWIRIHIFLSLFFIPIILKPHWALKFSLQSQKASNNNTKEIFSYAKYVKLILLSLFFGMLNVMCVNSAFGEGWGGNGKVMMRGSLETQKQNGVVGLWIVDTKPCQGAEEI